MRESRNRVIVLGSINNDIVVFAGRHPRVGETVKGNGFRTFPGGKGANQAVASAFAGVPTAMIGLVGDDAPGRDLRSFLESTGVDVSGVGISSSAPTGTALITVADGDNTIVVVAGANGDVSNDILEELVLSPNDVVLTQFETPTSTSTALFLAARVVGARTVLNPAPAMEIPPDLLSLVDYLIVNESEFALTFGFEPTAEIPADCKAFQTFEGVVIATIGARGVLVWVQGRRAHPEHIAGLSVDAVDSTAAGDCFCGYFAAGLARGASLDDALRIANRAAAISVTRIGAAASIPLLAEVKDR